MKIKAFILFLFLICLPFQNVLAGHDGSAFEECSQLKFNPMCNVQTTMTLDDKLIEKIVYLFETQTREDKSVELKDLKVDLNERLHYQKAMTDQIMREHDNLFTIISIMLTVTGVLLAGGIFYNIQTIWRHKKKSEELFKKIEADLIASLKKKEAETEDYLDTYRRITSLNYALDQNNFHSPLYYSHLTQLDQKPTLDMYPLLNRIVTEGNQKLDANIIEMANTIITKIRANENE